MPEAEAAAQTAAQPEANAANMESAAQPQPEANSAQTQPTPQPQGILNQDQASLPIADWSKVDLGLGDNTAVNADLLASFGNDVAVKLGLTEAQAKGAVEWQLNAIAAQKEKYLADQTAELKKAWGKDFQTNGDKVLRFLEAVDKKQGNDSFSKAIVNIGMLDNAAAITGLLSIAKLIEEDGIGNANQSGIGQAAETAEEGIAAMYKLARQGRQ